VKVDPKLARAAQKRALDRAARVVAHEAGAPEAVRAEEALDELAALVAGEAGEAAPQRSSSSIALGASVARISTARGSLSQ